jgi:hypothetical protein
VNNEDGLLVPEFFEFLCRAIKVMEDEVAETCCGAKVSERIIFGLVWPRFKCREDLGSAFFPGAGKKRSNQNKEQEKEPRHAYG